MVKNPPVCKCGEGSHIFATYRRASYYIPEDPGMANDIFCPFPTFQLFHPTYPGKKFKF